VAENLTRVGALECFGERAAVLKALETGIAAAQQRQKAADRGQMDMFGLVQSPVASAGATELPAVEAATGRERLEWEKELLGFYLSAHPLNDVVGTRPPRGYAQSIDLPERTPGERVRFIGMVVDVRRITTRTNKTMAIVKLEDLSGTIEVVCFPETFEQVSVHLENDAILEVTGKVDRRNEENQIIVDTMSRDLPDFEPSAPQDEPIVALRLPGSADVWGDISLMQRIDVVLRDHEGSAQLEFHLPRGSRLIRLRSRSRRVEWSDEFRREIEALLGDDSVSYIERKVVAQAAD
jgi:DNA polymerase-3 subunit alpha